MINASKEFKEKLKSGAVLANFADITLSDGTVLHLEPKDFMIGGCSIDDKSTNGKFGVGFCIGKTLKINLENNDERFSSYDFYMSIIHIYVGMLLDDGKIEKIKKGIYYTTIPQTKGDTIQINAVDGMYRLDRSYEGSITVYPATLQAIISDACLDCGIPIGFTQFDNMGYIAKEKPENSTYRQIVSWAAQIAGYNARIDNDGYMQLVWYNTNLIDGFNNYDGGSFKQYPHQTVLDGGNFKNYGTGEIISGALFTDEVPEHIFRFKSLDVHTDDVTITGVRVSGEDNVTSVFGEEGYLIDVKSNPFVNGKEDVVANYLGNRLTGMTFRQFSGQLLGNPLYEPYDVCMISDRKGNVYYSYINSVTYKIGGYTQIACQAEDPVKNGSSYMSPAASAVVEARRNVEKQISTYDKAVQNMNQLAANSLGFHTTYEDQPDGSRITYMHDKPTIEESTTIYKQTASGFFISTDGGQSYTAGFDSHGNAVVNVLYAIGIVCDWIRGGTLTLGGDNNVSGKFNLVDSNNKLLAKMDKSGLFVYKGNISGTYIRLGGLNNENGLLDSLDSEGRLKLQIQGNGMYLFEKDYFAGIIGTSHKTNNPNFRGISFLSETPTDYMTFSYKKAGDTDEYTPIFEITTDKSGRKCNMQADLDMHYYEVLNTSDERLKENITMSDVDALSILKEVQTYSFDWIENGEHKNIGFIAQQLESINDEFVHIDGNSGKYSTKELSMIPYLVKSIQQLSDQVNELKTEISGLTGEKNESTILRAKKKKTGWKPACYTKDEKLEYLKSLNQDIVLEK